jgi:hypothetical protein
MGTNNYQREFDKLKTLADDTTKRGTRRIQATIDLLEVATNQFGRVTENAMFVAKRILREFHGKKTSTPKERRMANDLNEYLITGKLPARDDKGEPQTVIDPESTAWLPLEGQLEIKNRNVYAEPPQKYIFFPTTRPEYLAEHYPQWFPSGLALKETVFDDPYNQTSLGLGDFRVINPNFGLAYGQWKRRRVGDTLPDLQSNWFLRFVEEWDAREWNALGTLTIDPSRPIGRELRRREYVSGFLKPSEVEFAWTLFVEILVRSEQKYDLRDPVTVLHYYFGAAPPNYPGEFDGIPVEEIPA